MWHFCQYSNITITLNYVLSARVSYDIIFYQYYIAYVTIMSNFDLLAENEEQQSELTATSPDAAAEAPPPPKKGKKIILIIVLLFVVCGAGFGVMMFMKQKNKEKAKEAEEAKVAAEKQQIFHDLDEFIVNLNTEGKSVSFMKITMTFDIEGQENLDTVNKMMPRIRDVFQIYLRELRPADMQGSVGLYRLREELLLRVNKVVYPANVKDILFKEVIVQ